MQKGRTGRVTIYEWRSPQEYSNCDLLIQRNSCQEWFMVIGRRTTTNLKDYRKGYYYPKGTSKHYQHEVSRVNLGFKTQGVEYLLLSGITGCFRE